MRCHPCRCRCRPPCCTFRSDALRVHPRRAAVGGSAAARGEPTMLQRRPGGVRTAWSVHPAPWWTPRSPGQSLDGIPARPFRRWAGRSVVDATQKCLRRPGSRSLSGRLLSLCLLIRDEPRQARRSADFRSTGQLGADVSPREGGEGNVHCRITCFGSDVLSGSSVSPGRSRPTPGPKAMTAQQRSALPHRQSESENGPRRRTCRVRTGLHDQSH